LKDTSISVSLIQGHPEIKGTKEIFCVMEEGSHNCGEGKSELKKNKQDILFTKR